jgi:hypothetical protein
MTEAKVFRRPSRIEALFNRLMGKLVALGMGPGYMRVLDVRGRKPGASSRPKSTFSRWTALSISWRLVETPSGYEMPGPRAALVCVEVAVARAIGLRRFHPKTVPIF